MSHYHYYGSGSFVGHSGTFFSFDSSSFNHTNNSKNWNWNTNSESAAATGYSGNSRFRSHPANGGADLGSDNLFGASSYSAPRFSQSCLREPAIKVNELQPVAGGLREVEMLSHPPPSCAATATATAVTSSSAIVAIDTSPSESVASTSTTLTAASESRQSSVSAPDTSDMRELMEILSSVRESEDVTK